MRKHIANIITSFRILCSILLLFFPPRSVMFSFLYLLCGLSDMIDGTVARKTNSASAFGSKFDTVADFIFMTISLLKLLPIIHIPFWLWVWITAITVMKIGNLIRGWIRRQTLISPHTVMNKISGLLLFLLPLTLHFMEPGYSCAVVCLAATIAAIQEGHYIGSGREIG